MATSSRRRALGERYNTPANSVGSTLAQKHGYLLIMLVAFVSGFLFGEHESNGVSNLAHKVGETVGLLDSEVSVAELLGRLYKNKLQIQQDMIQEYGDYYGRLFNDPFALQHVFPLSEASRARLRRRLLTKVLSKMDNPQAHVAFVWATAGDSSAAGHGNLFNQSYTAVMEDTVHRTFDALGVRFEARNYGMGWYSSAPELALCMEAVYGMDVDLLLWDFSMMDGDRLHRLKLFGERVGLHPNHPLLMVATDTSQGPGRTEVVADLENKGIGAFIMDSMAMNALRARIPDTHDELPSALRFMICNGAVEGSAPCDDPMRFFQCEQDGAEQCMTHKYKTHAGCDHEKLQKSFHPGWKDHNFRGKLLAHFLLDALEEALIELEPVKHPYGIQGSARAKIILERFKREDIKDLNRFQGSEIPQKYSDSDSETISRMSPSTLYRKPTVCHTAVLPSQSRYLGLSTESDKRGDYNGGYEIGQNKVLSQPVNGDHIPLTYDSSDRHSCASLKIDHRDYFYLRENDGWLRMIVPNRPEQQAYQRAPSEGLF